MGLCDAIRRTGMEKKVSTIVKRLSQYTAGMIHAESQRVLTPSGKGRGYALKEQIAKDISIIIADLPDTIRASLPYDRINSYSMS